MSWRISRLPRYKGNVVVVVCSKVVDLFKEIWSFGSFARFEGLKLVLESVAPVKNQGNPWRDW